jgi:hypothetical protein
VGDLDTLKQVYILKVTKVPGGNDDGVSILSADIKECVEGKTSIFVVIYIFYM